MKREFGKWNAASISISPPIESQTGLLRKLWAEAFAGGEFDPRRIARKKPQVRRFRMGLDITWVTERIGVGGGIWTAENMAAAARNGITHIIDMQIEFNDTPLAEPHGIAGLVESD